MRLNVTFQSNYMVDAVMGVLRPESRAELYSVAAMRTGRRAVLIEFEEKYCELAAKRLEAEPENPDNPEIAAISAECTRPLAITSETVRPRLLHIVPNPRRHCKREITTLQAPR